MDIKKLLQTFCQKQKLFYSGHIDAQAVKAAQPLGDHRSYNRISRRDPEAGKNCPIAPGSFTYRKI